jgi:hypothetical protein
MKKILVLVAVLYSAAAIAQSSPPAPAGSDPAKTPMVGDKPLVSVKPKAAKKKKDAAAQDAPADAAQDAPAAAPKASAKGGAKSTAKSSAKDSAKAAPGKPKSIAGRLQACLEVDDATKDRLNCYDAVIPPKPNPKAKAPAKAVTECSGFKEEDERLTCFNGFVERLPKLPS